MRELEALCRAQWGHLLAALIRTLGDFELAEDALQDAFAAAAEQWGAGAPRNPRGWLYATARHKAYDRLRRNRLLTQKLAEIGAGDGDAAPLAEEEGIPDERLRLIFTCCHPALSTEAQVALTLRTLCGLSTEDIAHAFLLPPATLAQRLVRAKAKIRDARIPYVVPEGDEVPERLAAVVAVLYLVFNEGYAAAQGEALVRRELCAEAIELTRLLRHLLPGPVAEVDALLALMLLQDARRETRLDERGELALLADQDRSRWDRARIAEGVALVQRALSAALPGPYALEAAIAAVHADAPTAADTDWSEIAALYERLYALHSSPVVALNRAVAVAMAAGPEAALPLVDELAPTLGGYHHWHATRADLLRRLGRRDDALAAYERARGLSQNEAERRFLARRIGELQG
jgi:RNA polymerase sigma-70 factor (ECF subfamily)